MKKFNLILAIALQIAGLTSAQTSLFDLQNATISGFPANTVGATYTFTQADPDNLFDVVATLSAMTSNSHLLQPRVETTVDSNTGTDFTSTAAPMLNALWTLDDGTVVTNYDASMTFDIKVYYTGTTNLASLDLYATTYDNDGAVNGPGSSTVLETVTYGGSPIFPHVGTAETQSGNIFTASSTTVNPGFGLQPAYSITALYNNASSFSWTVGNLITDQSGVGPLTSRMHGLEIGYSYSAVPEPSSCLLVGAAMFPLLFRRRPQGQRHGLAC